MILEGEAQSFILTWNILLWMCLTLLCFYFRQYHCEHWKWMHCSPHKHTNRRCSTIEFSGEEPGFRHVKHQIWVNFALTKLDCDSNGQISLQQVHFCFSDSFISAVFVCCVRMIAVSKQLCCCTVISYSTYYTPCQAYLTVTLWRQHPRFFPECGIVVYIFVCGHQRGVYFGTKS